MAQDNDAQKPLDKGKGKAVETKPEDSKKKDGQPEANGKKDEDKMGCTSSYPSTPTAARQLHGSSTS